MPDELKKDVDSTVHFQDQGQMRVLDLPGAIPSGETGLPLLPTDVAFEDQRRSDASMLKEAVSNRLESETFISTRGLIGRWNTAELMLRAAVEPVKWKGTDQFRSHLGIPLVASINSLNCLPSMLMSFSTTKAVSCRVKVLPSRAFEV